MTFAYNPITGELDLTGSSGGGGGETVIVGTAQTMSAPDVKTIITFNLGSVSRAFQIRVELIGNATNDTGTVGASETLTVSTDGITATLLGNVDTQQEYLRLTRFIAYTSVIGNTVVVRAFGSPSFNINWKATLTYLQVA